MREKRKFFRASNMAFKSRKSLSGPATPQKRISVAPIMTLPPRPKSMSRVPAVPAASSSRKPLFGLIALFVAVAAYMLVSANTSSRQPLCNTDGSPPFANTTCLPCPAHGSCAHGALQRCDTHYIIHGSDCIRDEQKFVNAAKMLDSMARRLEILRGRKECGESIEDSVYPEEFRSDLRLEFKSLSDDSFRASFELAVDGESEGVYYPSSIILTPMGLVRATIARKTISCRVSETVAEYGLSVLIFALLASFLGLKLSRWSAQRQLIKDLIKTIECHTQVVDERVQGLSVLDLRDQGMPLHPFDDRSARAVMASLVRAYPDIQSGEEISRAGEVVYWSSHRLRAEQARSSQPSRDPQSPAR